MNIILLSGGSGRRLWPLSNEVRSKQFIKIFKNENGDYESMVQRVYRQIREVAPDARITIATAETQISAIRNQLGDNLCISPEPERRDTFPAIALAAAHLSYEQGVDEDEPVVICPVDPYVELSYFRALKRLSELAGEGRADLSLLGILPTYPSEKYGYILPETAEEISAVSTFKEKPDVKTAEQYLAQGALWNGGVFALKLGYLLRRAHELMDFSDYWDLFHRYGQQKKISFDYAVVEHEKNIQVLRYTGSWADIGSWNTFAEAMDEPTVGRVTLDDSCENLHVINELNIPVLCMGCRDMVVAASNDGILVADKHQSSFIKPYADQLEQQVMFAEKSWGSFTVLDVREDSMTIRVLLNPGHRMRYHSHERRDEVWTVASGSGTATVDGMEVPLKPGDVVTMLAGVHHTVCAGEHGICLIEVQLGREISVHDKTVYER